ncbi:MAG: DUF2066 domain-containing protein [Rickettsiales bacterium]|nr:DUF2066 domain-containing protein [Rickettsiales bacterium]
MFRFIALLLSVCCLLMPLFAWAGEALVNSEVTVDITGKDATDARDKAMAKAHLDALADLLNKLAPPEQVQGIIASLDAKKIAAMVRGTEILDEKIASDRYRAQMRVSFDAAAISSLIGKISADVEKDDNITTSSFLIIPVFETEGNVMLWEDKNPWRNVWRMFGLEVNTGDIILPYGDANDSGILNTNNLATANYAAVAPLAIRYGVSDIIIAQATYKRNPDMTLNVVMRRINRSKVQANALTYRADPEETRDLLLARAARDIADNLRTKKTEELAQSKEVRGGERNKVMILASITTLGSWTDLREKLSSMPMVDRIELLAMSPQQVDMVLYYRGTAQSLASAMTAHKLRLAQTEKYWVISRD